MGSLVGYPLIFRKRGDAMPIQQDYHRQNILLKEYMNKYFSPSKIEELVGEFSFSELRRLLGEMDIEFFALCYFPKYFDREFGKFHRELLMN